MVMIVALVFGPSRRLTASALMTSFALRAAGCVAAAMVEDVDSVLPCAGASLARVEGAGGGGGAASTGVGVKVGWGERIAVWSTGGSPFDELLGPQASRITGHSTRITVVANRLINLPQTVSIKAMRWIL